MAESAGPPPRNELATSPDINELGKALRCRNTAAGDRLTCLSTQIFNHYSQFDRLDLKGFSKVRQCHCLHTVCLAPFPTVCALQCAPPCISGTLRTTQRVPAARGVGCFVWAGFQRGMESGDGRARGPRCAALRGSLHCYPHSGDDAGVGVKAVRDNSQCMPGEKRG